MKFILTLLLVLSAPLCNAGALSTIITEIIEATGKSLTKTNTDMLIPVATQAAKPILRTIDIKRSAEDQITDLIKIGNDVCNSNDYDLYIKFYKTYAHPNSLEMNEGLSDFSLLLFKNYKFTCNVKNVEFIGSGESLNIENKFAYAVVEQSDAISGILSVSSRSMHIFKLDNKTWKLWDTITFKETLEPIKESWWFYNKNKDKCEVINESSDYYPINIFKHNGLALECSSKGLQKDTLIIKCNEHKNIPSQTYIYSTKESMCDIYSQI